MVFAREGQKELTNIAVLGKEGSGKSSFIQSYIESAFLSDLPSTEVMQISHKEDENSILAFWEFPESSKKIRGQFISQTDGIIYLVDSQNIPSEEIIRNDFQSISNALNGKSVPVAIAVSKMDSQLNSKFDLKLILRIMSTVTDFIEKEQVRLFEVSSKQLAGTKICIDWVVEKILNLNHLTSSEDDKTCVFAVLKLGDIGPEIIFTDFEEFPDPLVKGNTEEYLNNLGISLSIALAQGNAFSEGIFELPAGYSTKYRLIATSVKLHDTTLQDERHENVGYAIFCFFLTPDTIARVPKLVTIQDEVLEMLYTIENIGAFTKDQFISTRDDILKVFFK